MITIFAAGALCHPPKELLLSESKKRSSEPVDYSTGSSLERLFCLPTTGAKLSPSFKELLGSWTTKILSYGQVLTPADCDVPQETDVSWIEKNLGVHSSLSTFTSHAEFQNHFETKRILDKNFFLNFTPTGSSLSSSESDLWEGSSQTDFISGVLLRPVHTELVHNGRLRIDPGIETVASLSEATALVAQANKFLKDLGLQIILLSPSLWYLSFLSEASSKECVTDINSLKNKNSGQMLIQQLSRLDTYPARMNIGFSVSLPQGFSAVLWQKIVTLVQMAWFASNELRNLHANNIWFEGFVKPVDFMLEKQPRLPVWNKIWSNDKSMLGLAHFKKIPYACLKSSKICHKSQDGPNILFWYDFWEEMSRQYLLNTDDSQPVWQHFSENSESIIRSIAPQYTDPVRLILTGTNTSFECCYNQRDRFAIWRLGSRNKRINALWETRILKTCL